jgi:extracellular factor (EF) 3-hydroxypalmitic acid methyl ester biosynthesis protein
MLAPGGLLLATNVDRSNPRCLTMDYMMEWVVTYRNAAEMAELKPDAVAADGFKIESDLTGVNLYFESRRSNRE